MDIAAPAAEVIESIIPLVGLFLLVVVAGAVPELVGRRGKDGGSLSGCVNEEQAV